MRLRRPRALAAALAAAATVALAVAASAGAAVDDPSLRFADTSRLPLVRLVVSAPGTSADAPPAFAATENGRPVSGLAVSSPDAAAAIGVAIDTSQSMIGDPLTRALGAAAGFAGDKRPVDQIAVVGFDATSAVAQTLTDDTATLRTSIGSLALGATKGTALYDGIRDAIEATAGADPTSRRVVVVLTDGADTSSTTTLDQVVALAQSEGVVVHAIAVAGRGADPKALQRITRETGGTLRAAEADEIAGLYDAIAAEIASTYEVTYRSTAHDDVSLGARRRRRAPHRDLHRHRGARRARPGGRPRPARRHREELVRAGARPPRRGARPLRGAPPLPGAPPPLADRAPRAVRRRHAARRGGARRRARDRRRPRDLDRDGARARAPAPVAEPLRRARPRRRALRPAGLFYLMLGAGLALAIPMTLLGVPLPVRLVGLVGGFSAPFMIVRMKAAKREKAFDGQLPDVLVAMAASLKAGHSFNQAVDAIIRDGTEPAKKEFGRAANQIRLGRSADEALEDMAHRLNSKNFEFVVLCVNIQRQVGGSLAELLDSVAETVRQRQQFARKVKALIAMGKMSAYALIALPFIMAGVISVINRDYMKPLFETSTGNVMLGMAGGGILLGTLMLKKIVSFKVD